MRSVQVPGTKVQFGRAREPKSGKSVKQKRGASSGGRGRSARRRHLCRSRGRKRHRSAGPGRSHRPHQENRSRQSVWVRRAVIDDCGVLVQVEAVGQVADGRATVRVRSEVGATAAFWCGDPTRVGREHHVEWTVDEDMAWGGNTRPASLFSPGVAEAEDGRIVFRGRLGLTGDGGAFLEVAGTRILLAPGLPRSTGLGPTSCPPFSPGPRRNQPGQRTSRSPLRYSAGQGLRCGGASTNRLFPGSESAVRSGRAHTEAGRQATPSARRGQRVHDRAKHFPVRYRSRSTALPCRRGLNGGISGAAIFHSPSGTSARSRSIVRAGDHASKWLRPMSARSRVRKLPSPVS